MTRPRFAILALFVLLNATAHAEAVDKDKLREAVCLPRLSFSSNFHFRGATGFSLEGDDTPLSEQITDLRKALKIDPANAELNIRLASLVAKDGSEDESKNFYTKAAELCRRQLSQHPDDILQRLFLAEALQGLEQDDEAEALLRRTAKDAPKNWQCWLALAEYLGSKSRQIIMRKNPWHYNSPETLLQAMRAARPTQERITASQPYRKEADACFDRAIALAPREAKIYRRRVSHRGLNRVIDCGIRMYKGEKVDPAEIYLFPSEELEDLCRIADLRGDDYVAIGALTFFEASKELIERHSHHPASKLPAKWIDRLSPATRKRVSENLKRLEKGMRDPDKHKAATAASILGTFQFSMLKDERAAEKSLRRSIELDPGRDNAWDTLTAILMTEQKFSEAVEICRRRVKHKDTAHNRLCLAIAYEYLDQLDNAEGEIRTGLRHAPDDFMLNLALANLILMRGYDDDLNRAGELLCKVEKNRSPGASGENRWINYTYTCGIFYGLRGNVAEARRFLEEVQRRNPEILPVKEALQALNESGEHAAPSRKQTPLPP